MFMVNIMEQIVGAEAQEIITSDNLKATVDAHLYFRVVADRESVKNSQ